MEEPDEFQDCEVESMFTPQGRQAGVARSDFSGFRSDSATLRDNSLGKRIIDLEGQVKELLERLKESEHSVEVLRAENVVQRSDLSDLCEHVITNKQKLEENNDKVNPMDEKQNVM